MAEDLDRCLTFDPFPEAHGSHLRTRNPIESIFATLRLRTNASQRFQRTKSGVRLVYPVLARRKRSWRRLKSAPLCATVPLPQSPGRRPTDVA